MKVHLISLNLHSNMVIFKFKNNYLAGTIEIQFTFQSGDIQIKTLWGQILTLQKTIYIPIW